MGANVVGVRSISYTAKQEVTVNGLLDIARGYDVIKFPRFRCDDDPRQIFIQVELKPFHFATQPQKLGGFDVSMAAFDSDQAENDSRPLAGSLPPTTFVKAVRIQQWHYDEASLAPEAFRLPWRTSKKVQTLFDMDVLDEAGPNPGYVGANPGY